MNTSTSWGGSSSTGALNLDLSFGVLSARPTSCSAAHFAACAQIAMVGVRAGGKGRVSRAETCLVEPSFPALSDGVSQLLPGGNGARSHPRSRFRVPLGCTPRGSPSAQLHAIALSSPPLAPPPLPQSTGGKKELPCEREGPLPWRRYIARGAPDVDLIASHAGEAQGIAAGRQQPPRRRPLATARFVPQVRSLLPIGHHL